MLRILPILCIVAVLAVCGRADAKKRHKPVKTETSGNSEHGSVWRKRVVRRVYLPVHFDEQNNMVADPGQVELLKMIIDDGLKGKITCFEEPGMKNVYRVSDIKQLVTPELDTTAIKEAATGKATIRIDTGGFIFRRFTQFRVCEEWTYNLNTGITKIKITGFGPAHDIYVDGYYRGVRTFLWIKWADVTNYLKDSLIANLVEKAVWEDYFKDSGLVSRSCSDCLKDIKRKKWAGNSVRKINIVPDSITYYSDPNLTTQYSDEDSSITGLLYENMANRLITGYRDDHFRKGKKLTDTAMKNVIATKDDTVVADDPITGTEVSHIVHHDFCFGCVRGYYVAEQWKFDLLKGEAEITFTGIMPTREIRNDEGTIIGDSPMFWVNYSDARKVLAAYNEYNPRYNIEWQVWQDRFNEPKRKRE